MQLRLERPKSTQMQSVTHTTTCALVGDTIPGPNDGLLPPACPGFRQTAAYAIISLFIYFSDLGKVLEN
jgi:hypothetical protein